MRNIKKIIVILILLCPLTPHFYKIADASFTFHLIDEKAKLQKSTYFKDLFSVLDFLNNLQGTALVMSQGLFLHYTNLDLMYIYDKRFFDIFSRNQDLQKINYIVLNQINDPVMYSPLLENILYEPQKSQLIFDFFGWKVFELGTYNVQSSKTDFHISQAEKGAYISHKNELPSLNTTPKMATGDFPSLTPGLYDFVCEMMVEVDQDTKIDFNIYPNFKNCGAHVFFLKKGKNKLLTRFLHSHEPFRLVAFSNNQNITFHDLKLSYAFKKALLPSEKLLTFTFTNTEIPFTTNKDEKSVVKVNKYEVFFFEKPFLNGQSLTFKASGYGTLVVAVSPYSKQLSKLCRWSFGRWVLRFLPIKTYKYTIHDKEEFISIPFDKKSNVLIYLDHGNNSNEQDFSLTSLSIERGT